MTHGGSQPLVEAAFRASGVNPAVRISVMQIASIVGMVREKFGWSVIAKLALPQQHEGVVGRPLHPRVVRRVGLAVRSIDKATPAARAFLDIARTSKSLLKGIV